MNPLNLFLILAYTTIIVSLIWARFRFFEISQSTPTFVAKFYDPAVFLQFLFTSHGLLTLEESPESRIFATAILYSIALFLFWWAVFTTKRMGFALTSKIERVFTTGPFAWIRHPFYTSYSCIWIGSSLLFNSWILWITLMYLLVFYYQVATREEKIIIEGEHSRAYLEYRQHVGMFFPRIIGWKQ